MDKKITIIGSGLAGSFMAICLGKLGYQVDMYERHPDIRRTSLVSGRSFNLTLYLRGILALKKIGVWDEVKKYAILVEGNVAHYENGKKIFDVFDKKGNEVLYTIHRTSLNKVLISEAEKLQSVKFFFNNKVVSIDRSKKRIYFQNTETKKFVEKEAELIIGADGVNSVVREEIQRGQDSSHRQEYLDWGYKEIPIAKKLSEKLGWRKNSTHTWPKNNSLLIAFPNFDESFTLMANMPFQGADSFEILNSRKTIKKYLSSFFPDLLLALDTISDSFANNPLGRLVTIYTTPWHYKDFMVLVGDAAHGVIPFYGQGMCAAFEDCLSLVDYITKKSGNLNDALNKFEKTRKRNTDVLADLSKRNFIELRDKSRSSLFIAKEKIDTALHQLFPSFWLPPLYNLIAHDTFDYADAFERYNKQQKLSNWIGIGLLAFVISIPLTFIQRHLDQ